MYGTFQWHCVHKNDEENTFTQPMHICTVVRDNSLLQLT